MVSREVTFYSAALLRGTSYRVFLPEKRSAGQRFPVVYLLHGNGGSYADWSANSDVASYAMTGMILVMPEGGSSYFLNAARGSEDRYEDFLASDLIRDVQERFPARTDRKGRALVGVSMGGFAGIKLALSRPDLYAFVGALSPPVDVPERRFTWRRAGQWWSFRRIFGPMGSAERDARDPFVLVKSADPKATPYIYLSAGAAEALREPIQRFDGQLTRRGFAHEFHVRPGGHDWSEWNSQVPECFAKLVMVPGGK